MGHDHVDFRAGQDLPRDSIDAVPELSWRRAEEISANWNVKE